MALNISEAINKSGLKKKYIAEKLKIRPETLSRKLQQPEKFNAEEMSRLSVILKIPITDLDFTVHFFNY